MAATDGGPYVGPRPFERADRALFFGRDGEAAALASLIVAHPVVLLYAQSGAGKSSLLNAEVAPRLEARGFEVFAGMRVSGDLPAGVAAAAVRNVYVYNALASLARSGAGADSGPATTLRGYLKSLPHPPATKAVASIRILVFDQFEEVFTSFAERWKDRADFFDDVGAALEEDPRLRVVFAMREEFIGGLDAYADRLPERLRTRFHLERLGAKAALLAVTRPLETTDRRFRPEAAQKLIDNLLKVPIRSPTGVTDVSGEYVEPLHLQLVCTKLWNSLPAGVKDIDESYIENLGDVDEALADYYERCIREVAAAAGVSEGTLRAWFERTLITADGVRGLVPKGDEFTGGLANAAVERLQRLYLIRTEMRGVNPWYELTHDRFVAPIRSSNERWRDTAGVGQNNVLELEARAQRWARDGRPPRALLPRREFARAAALLASPELKAFGVSSVAQEYMQDSERAATARGRRVQLAATGAILVAVAVVALLAWVAKLDVEDRTALALAETAKKLATKPGLEFDAVAYAMRASEPRLHSWRGPHPGASDGLREVLHVVGPDVWLRGYTGEVTLIGIAPDGRHAIARGNAEVCAWDATNGRPLFDCLKPPMDSGAEVFFSPDRKWVYKSGLRDAEDRAAMWDAQTGKPAFAQEFAGTKAIAFSRDGRWAVAVDAGGKALLADLARGAIAGAVALPQGVVDREESLAIAPGGDPIALITPRGGVELWSTRTPGRIALPMPALGDNAYNSLRFSPDAKRMAVTSVDFAEGQARALVWTLAAGGVAGPPATIALEGLGAPPEFEMQFSADSATVTTRTADAAQVWDAATGAAIAELPLREHAIARLHGDGRLVLAAIADGQTTLALVDPGTGKRLAEHRVTGELSNFDASSDFSRIVTQGKNNLLRVSTTGAQPVRLEDLSPEALFALACAKLRHQRDFTTIEEEVRKACDSTGQ